MPNLAQMFALVDARSGYTRPAGEIYSALDEGGFLVYTAVLKEFSGFFLKFDTTTVVLTPGISVYALPPDLTLLVAIAERLTAAQNWEPMYPTTLASALDSTQDAVGWDDSNYGDGSAFGFYGPYLPATAAAGTQTQSINVSPAIDQIRMCEIAYTAKWLTIVNGNSPMMMPNEGTYAMQNFAAAELNRANNDSLSNEYETKAQRHLNAFLTWVRNRQIVKWPTIEPYLGGASGGGYGDSLSPPAAAPIVPVAPILVALATSAPGAFTVAHGMGAAPSAAIIQMTAGGQIWFQTPVMYDGTYLYLIASDAGLTGYAICMR
jgi:hypothetical protein